MEIVQHTVRNSGVCGKKEIRKWECVNHVARRLGTELKNLYKNTVIEVRGGKATKKKITLGGKSKFAVKVIERLQYYFTESIK